MSIKLYNGLRRVFTDGFDLIKWQNDLAELRAELEAQAQKSVLDDMLCRAVYRMDRFHAGLPIEDPKVSHIHVAYHVIEKDCDKLRKGQRRPGFDTEVNLSWKLLDDQKTVLALVYGERPWRDHVIEAMALEDYHYQNQVDHPEDMTYEAFQARGEVWEAAFGGSWNNPPAAFFHNFLVVPAPTVPLIGWMPEPPKVPEMALDRRVHNVSFDHLFTEVEDRAKGKDIWAKYRWARVQVKEGGELHDRMQEIKSKMEAKLIAEPTFEDLKDKPSECAP